MGTIQGMGLLIIWAPSLSEPKQIFMIDEMHSRSQKGRQIRLFVYSKKMKRNM